MMASLNPRGTGGSPRFVLLFSYMMVELAILPIFESSMVLGTVGDLAFFVFLFFTVASITRGRTYWLNAVLFAITMLFYLAFLFNREHLVFPVLVNFLACAFVLQAIASVAVFILIHNKITISGVLGGLCVYLLIGMVFATLYLNVELLRPNSFYFGIHGKDPSFLQLYDLLYFYSFTTLLTIGYGDIIPMSHLAQTLAVLEGVIGQFYIVFFVAVLVGMYLHERTSNNTGAGST